MFVLCLVGSALLAPHGAIPNVLTFSGSEKLAELLAKDETYPSIMAKELSFRNGTRLDSCFGSGLD
jgi:hypothetical protein